MNTVDTELGVIITNTKARQVIYGIYVILVIIAGGVQVYFNALHTTSPIELTGAINVLAYLGAPIGALALANAPSRTATPATLPTSAATLSAPAVVASQPSGVLPPSPQPPVQP